RNGLQVVSRSAAHAEHQQGASQCTKESLTIHRRVPPKGNLPHRRSIRHTWQGNQSHDTVRTYNPSPIAYPRSEPKLRTCRHTGYCLKSCVYPVPRSPMPEVRRSSTITPCPINPCPVTPGLLGRSPHHRLTRSPTFTSGMNSEPPGATFRPLALS